MLSPQRDGANRSYPAHGPEGLSLLPQSVGLPGNAVPYAGCRVLVRSGCRYSRWVPGHCPRRGRSNRGCMGTLKR